MKLRHQLIGAALSGALVCLSFPTVLFGWHAPEMGWLAWFALVPLFIAIREAGPRRAFVATFLMGLIAYSGSLYWIFRAMNTYGKLPASTSALVMALMIVILAAYIALAPMLARLIKMRWQGELIALLPACWVAVELLRNYGPVGGFPWADVSMSQWRAVYVIQIVDAVGIYGLIFLIVWVNVCLAEIAARLMGARVAQLPLKIGITAVLVLATLAYGYVRIREVGGDLAQAGDMKIGMVQANIPQEDKWKDSKAMDNLDAYRGPTGSLGEAGVDLVVWPEASFPWPIDTRAIKTDPVALGLGREALGALPFVLMGAISERPDGMYHNSVVLFDAQGEIKGRYHKAHLVPFGEYVPYKKLLFFAEKLTEPIGNFKPGTSFEPLDIGGRMAGPLVCYEDIFPEISRRLVSRGAQFLVNVTNDAWYGESSAAFQHLALAVFRAVETRRFLVRATNTGVSAVVAPTGRINTMSGIFHDAVIVAPIGLRDEMTPYVRYGDWFAYACAAYVLLGLVMVALDRIRGRRRQT